jgi:antitoxin (DNA-binding transcriptional repressor) of toxin-antitoxin stability system
VGIRELRDGLSRCLAEVRRGRTITVIDHGRAVARIVPVDGPSALEGRGDLAVAFPIAARQKPDLARG